jgi:hypothetical protein
MSFPSIHTALAYERHKTLLEAAQTNRRAREARAYRRAHGTRAIHGSSFRWMPSRLASAWRRLPSSQPRSRSEAAG